MSLSLSQLLVRLTLVGISLASPLLKDKRSTVVESGVTYTVFEHAATNSVVKYVTNSGICETTPGVNQYSGYFSVGDNANMWFWYFEARNNPTTAPLAAWFNGGPGCSSMIGLFQENGPCHFENGASTPTLNPNSWNEYANMLYVDQPIGTGFSYGSDPVDSTLTAAPYVWALLQAFYGSFPQYESRDFGIFTESYGGHYGSEFADYLEQQNAAIASGSLAGQTINLVALGINNGWFDAKIGYKAYVDYSYSNQYRKLITEKEHESYLDTYQSRCAPAIDVCANTGSDSDCSAATGVCADDIETPLSQTANFDVYDIRAPSNDPNPPETYLNYLSSPAVVKAIGAQSTYQECADAPYEQFSQTGDDARSFLSELSTVVASGVTTLIWSGGADWICNAVGCQAAAEALTWPGQSQFVNLSLASYTVKGVAGGNFKTVDNLSFLEVFGAGHEVPFYTPELALQVFKQTMQKQAISST